MRAKMPAGQATAPRDDSSAKWAKGLSRSDALNTEIALGIFEPDILISQQFCAIYRPTMNLEAEKLLMLAVLWDAVSCFQANLGARNHRKRQLFLDAEQWILDRSRSNLFSFDNICELLGFEPNYVRQGLLSWKESVVLKRDGHGVTS